ncbi:MAG: serine hydrolase [Hyphomonadaceae bacterium]
MTAAGFSKMRLVAALRRSLHWAWRLASAQDRYAAIVMDARTNEVLLEDQADEARFPASLTKMMTLYMLFEAIERGDLTLDTRLTASRNAARQPPSRLGLACSRRRGCDSITVDQAIRALAVQSANDVAVMVAERLGGDGSRLSANMTARARELGMSNTRFANASGLPDTAAPHDSARYGDALAGAVARFPAILSLLPDTQLRLATHQRPQPQSSSRQR